MYVFLNEQGIGVSGTLVQWHVIAICLASVYLVLGFRKSAQMIKEYYAEDISLVKNMWLDDRFFPFSGTWLKPCRGTAWAECCSEQAEYISASLLLTFGSFINAIIILIQSFWFIPKLIAIVFKIIFFVVKTPFVLLINSILSGVVKGSKS